MKKSPIYKTNKRAANLMADSELRGFNANIKAWSEAFKSSDVVKSVFAEDGLTLDMFKFEYIKENLKGRFDSKGRFCVLKKFETEEELTAFVAAIEGADYDTTKADKYICFIPRSRFAAGTFYQIIKAANTAKVRADLKAAKEAAEAKKAAEAAEKRAERIEKKRAELAALEAMQAGAPVVEVTEDKKKEEKSTKTKTAKKQQKAA